MKKELKDYLHLYLGCDLMAVCDYDHWDDDEGQSHTKFKTGNIFRGNKDNTRMYFESEGVFKPILRPLSAMTKEEAENLGFEDESHFYNECIDGNTSIVFQKAEMFLILLKQQFDLFGLIESGLAIEKKSNLNSGEKLTIKPK